MDERYSDLEPEDFAAEAIDMGVGEGETGFAGSSYEAEGEAEADEFGRLYRRLRKQAQPFLRQLAPIAARAVMGGGLAFPLGEDEDEYEDIAGGGNEREDPIAYEDEGELEDETDAVPGLSAEDEAMAEALAAAAMATDSDQEAAGLVGGLTIQILGPAPVRIRRMTPVMIRRATRLVNVLRRSPRTRPLVPLVGTITKATTKRLIRRDAAGRSITPNVVTATMATQTARTLRNPRKVARGLVGNRLKRQRLNRRLVARAER